MTSHATGSRLVPRSALLMLILAACSGETTGPSLTSRGAVALARSTGGTTSTIDITSVLPDTGRAGTTMDVRVRGKGFDALSVVDFALDGTIDSAEIRTNSTRYVSSSELVANITIAPTATVTTWDVIVTSKGKTGIGTESDIFEVLDPIISWYAPIGDASLAIAGDGKYPENGYSVYSHKVCKVETALFLGGSGDATLSTAPPKGTGCGRTFTFTYPDGVSETLAVFANAVLLHHETSSIPVGATVRRKFNWNPGVLTTQASGRCGRVVYGQRDAVAVGSDSVEVTRVDPRTWMVQTGGNHLGWCESRNELYRMPFRLMLRSNISLP